MFKEFIETVRNFPDVLRQYFRAFKIAYKETKHKVVIQFIISILIGFIPYFRNFIQGNLINALSESIKNHDTKILMVPVILLISMIVLPTILNIVNQFINKDYRFNFQKKLMLMKTLKDSEIDPQLLEDKDFTNLKNKIESKGVMTVSNFYVTINDYLLEIAIFIVLSFTIYSFSHKGFVVLFLTSLPILITRMNYGQDSWFIWGNDIDTEKRKKMGDFRNYFEVFSNYIEIRLTKSYGYFIKYINDFFDESYAKQHHTEKKLFKYSMISGLISIVGIVYVIFDLLNKVIGEKMQVGTFIFAFSLVVQFTFSLSYIFAKLGFIYPDYKYVKEFFQYIDSKPIIKNTGKEKVSDTPPTIEFKNISFKYPNTEKEVLKNFNLTISAGDKLAVIGLNGAGKTTFVKLLCRFYDPTEGQILLNGKDLREYNLDDWYEQLGVLFQEYGKYHIPVEDLVSLGRHSEKIDHEKVTNSLKIAEADFVNSLPEKERTMLGKHYTDGVDISVGQWQKLAIARMFYRDPSVMVLDEPTSSIDAEAEAKIFETLEKLTKDKTVIMISHRFSTVRNADKICVIKDGSLHEYGTHEELLALKKGEYARLFKLQAEGYK